MVRILTVTHYFSTHRGGIERVAAELAQRVAGQRDCSVGWFSSDTDPLPAASNVDCLAVPAWNGLERIGFPWPVWGPRSIYRLWTNVRMSQVVHVHDFIYQGNLCAPAFARFLGRPTVVTQHIGDIPYQNAFARYLLKAINRTVGRAALSSADRVVFISEAVKRQFEGFICFRAPPLYLANGVDRNVFRPVDETERRKTREILGVGPNERVLLFVGRFVEKKGLPFLRRLASAAPEYHWWCAGWGEAASALHPGTWKLPQVRVFEGRSGVSLAQLYQAADLLVLPSWGEGFPLVVQEAMSCGTPALVSTETAAGAPHIKSLMTAPLDSPQSEHTWLETIRRHWESETRPTVRQRTAEEACELWDWDACALQYAKMFGDIAADGADVKRRHTGSPTCRGS